MMMMMLVAGVLARRYELNGVRRRAAADITSCKGQASVGILYVSRGTFCRYARCHYIDSTIILPLVIPFNLQQQEQYVNQQHVAVHIDRWL
jgi:hypothetical protein